MNNMSYLGASAIVDAWGLQIAAFLNEGGVTDQLRGRPFVDLSSAVVADVVYLAIVFFGVVLRNYLPKMELYALRFVYNLVQMGLCAYMFIEAGKLAYNHGYSFHCNKWNLEEPVMANILYIFYISKILDFCDTFFIIAKQNWKQLSFLHVYHHSTVFLLYWTLVNTDTDGDIYWTILLNGFIHFIMYTYYFMSMHTRDIWWKKYLTQMQLIQFMGMMVHAIVILHAGCRDTALRVVYMYVSYLITMLGLFAHFYTKTYTKPSKKTE